MPSYREITVAGEGRPRRAAGTRGRPAWAGWRAALTETLADAVYLTRRRPGLVAGAAAALGAAAFVCVNALGHQHGRHPAPILPKVVAKENTPREAVREIPLREAAAKPPAAPAVEAKVAAAPKPAPRDAIADLIRSEDTTASVTPKAVRPKVAAPIKPEAAKAEPARTAKPDEASVLQAQKALAKLGYGTVKADGAMGPSTRAAIETFERGAGLPVTGAASGRTLRALVFKAGEG